ncbi:s-phase kinase-associated protein 1 [Xylaria arbuscula]|nr:s-phase kinase-associated protein 1 [Xylaria arbuscula]
MSTNPIVTVISSDGFELQASFAAVKQCITLGTMLELLEEEQTAGIPIPVPGVDGETLTKIIEWCEYHSSDPIPDLKKDAKTKASTWDIPKWDSYFLAGIDDDMLFRITNAANYLEIPLLLHYATRRIGMLLGPMGIEEMREFLNIENDWTPDQEARLREDSVWAF